jgi:hypothetical protein
MTKARDLADIISGGFTASDIPSLDASKITTGTLSTDRYVDNDTVYTHPTSAGNKHVPTGGSSGEFLKYDASGTAVWAGVDALPTQTSHSGKYLTTNGSAASWDTLDTDANTTTKGLYEHSNVISVNYVIGNNNNSLTAGPISIDTGISVTIPSGSTWVIA